MLSRRVLLGGAACAALAGCGVLPGPAAPTLAPTPDPSVPGHAALHALRAALDDTLAGALTRGQADLLAWARDVTDDQFPAVSLAVPDAAAPTPSLVAGPTPTPSASASVGADPTPGASATPAPAPAPAPVPPGLADALATAAEAFTTQALNAATARPVVWASMAAWCHAVAAQLPDAAGAREPARGVRLPAPQEAADAAQTALDAADAARYGLEVAAGAPGLADDEVRALRARLVFWSGLHADLLGALATASASPSPAPPWYAVERPADAAAGRALAARLQASALPVLGRTLAHGPADLRPVLASALGDVAADVPRWGGLVERWPGLPAS